MKRCVNIVSIMAVLTFVVGMAACNTTKGVGADIESAGSGLKHSAERNGAE